MKTTMLAFAAAVAAGTLAHAQEAVQWRVEDGGNGHWYALDGVNPLGMNWADAESTAVAHGAHLASITSAAENGFLVAYTNAAAPTYGTYWIGGYRTDPSCSPPCFTWSSGEPWGFENWGPGGEPFDTWGCWGPNPNNCGWMGLGTGLAVEFITWGPYAGLWNDETPDLIGTGASGAPFIIEWSADCNGDGIVDYGQILDGTFEDANENGVPDCCDHGVSCDPCSADVNEDGVVNGADISAVLGFWGLAGKPLPAADITRDGIVDGADLAVLLGSWGPCQ